MKIVKVDERQNQRGPSEWFTGEVWMDEIVRGEAPSRLQAVFVAFAPAARTAWHTHPVGQTLHVLSGICRVQLRGAPVQTLNPGDTVQIAPGEMHWHGAAPGDGMVHLAMQESDESGVNVKWFEHVSDEQYEGRE
ncbi:MAG: cupin domain-containing protein [Acidobacteriaceae bacterium]|nr:cupin domain-containing protein [Acidobacteriaceae bacterium]